MYFCVCVIQEKKGGSERERGGGGAYERVFPSQEQGVSSASPLVTYSQDLLTKPQVSSPALQ